MVFLFFTLDTINFASTIDSRFTAWWLLLEHGHCEPFLRCFSLQSLDDQIELKYKPLISDISLFRIDRVACPLNDRSVADAVDLAKLGQDFLHFVIVFLPWLVEHFDDLLNEHAVAFWSRQQLIKDLSVELICFLEVLQAFLCPVQDSLSEDRAVLNDLEKLLT